MATRPKTTYEADRAPCPSTGAAHAYNSAGRDYLSYADGDSTKPFDFSGRYGFADHEIWNRIEGELMNLAATGRRSVRLLDAGCGPGTWSKRIALRARDLGFTDVEVHGVDISAGMIALAQASADHIANRGIRARYAVGDITDGLDFRDSAFDITLCLYGVLNHVDANRHDDTAAELSRVTDGTLFATVRTVGSLPTIYIDELDRARAFHQDNDADWMQVDFTDGRRVGFVSHLFTSRDLQRLFEPFMRCTAMHGLDVFHSRFAPNVHWNPPSIAGQGAFEHSLDELERKYGSDPDFIDRAAHILLVGSH